jgi:hypothetical protein
MQVTFREKHRSFFKDPNKPMESYGADVWNLLLPSSELMLLVKTEGIDQEHAPWWSKRADGTSSIRAVCLAEDSDFVPDWPTHTCIDVLFTQNEDDAEVIKGVGSAYLHETKLPFPDMDFVGSGIPIFSNDAIVSIEFVRKLSTEDWNYYKDLMHRSDKALRLFHSYEEREKELRSERKKSLKPKLVWPIVSATIFLVIQGLDLLDGGFLQWLSYILLLPAINYVFRWFRYFMFKT